MRWALCCPLFVGLVLPKLFDLAWLVADTKYHPCRYAIFFLFPSPPVPNMSADTPRKGRDPEDRNEVEFRSSGSSGRQHTPSQPADGDNAPAQKGGRRSLVQALG